MDRYRSVFLLSPGSGGLDRVLRWYERAANTDCRIILSDGIHFIQSMLATQLNPLVEDKSLDKNVVIKLTQFVVNQVQGRK